MIRKNTDSKLSFWDSYPNLQNDLAKVRKVIQKQISIGNTSLGRALKYNFNKPGKMLRPALILLFSRARTQKMINIAAAIEMLHNATLIHDDIIDESSIRHGQDSIQYKFGKHIAVYAGDYLFAVSLNLLSNNASVMESIKTNSKTMEEILQGEVEQYDHTYHNITITDYLEQIKGKTAVLFGLSCFLGSFESGSGLLLSRRAKQFGEELGIAFQLRDDILDYTVSEDQFQKPVLLDVKDGVYSGPLIFALMKDDKQELRQLVEKGKKLTNTDLKQIRNLVNEMGGTAQAQKLAQLHSQKALSLLEKHFQNIPNYRIIHDLTLKMLNRDY